MYNLLKSDIPQLVKLLEFIESKSDGVKWEDMQTLVDSNRLEKYLTILRLHNLIRDYDLGDDGLVIARQKDMIYRFRENNGFEGLYKIQERERADKINQYFTHKWQRWTFWITTIISIIAFILSIYNTFWSKSGK